MAKAFRTATALRASLEERLRQRSLGENAPLATLRLKVAMERLLARLFVHPDAPWRLKGGYAMELRYRPRARTTKDVDLSVSSSDGDLNSRIFQVRDNLQAAAEQSSEDYFEFQIGAASRELEGAPEGGARFPIEARLAGRSFAKFHLDVGFGDAAGSRSDLLYGQDFLGFAGILPARVLAISKPQQFAEKLHAYTFPWRDRPNTRTKDLVDLVLFVTVDPPEPLELAQAIEATFRLRKTHLLPSTLPLPPPSWSLVYAALAEEARLGITDTWEALRVVATFLEKLP